jgi:hypothetical protein
MIDLEGKRRRDREYYARKQAAKVPVPRKQRKQRKPRYDPADYRDELQEMVLDGLSSKEFITRSLPSATWFQRHVMPICTVSKCHACSRYFNPAEVGMLMECTSPRCPVRKENGRF